MADPAKILERVRSYGANIILDSGNLRFINRKKLPDEAIPVIRQNAKAIAAYLDQEAEFEERAAIVEFDGHTPRQWAEQFAQFCIKNRPEGVSDLDWSWFITQCGKIVDEVPRGGEVQGRAA